MLKDFDKDVRKAAVETLGKLDSADLATRAAAFVTWLKDARELAIARACHIHRACWDHEFFALKARTTLAIRAVLWSGRGGRSQGIRVHACGTRLGLSHHYRTQ